MECQLGYLVMLVSDGICNYDKKYANMNKNIYQFLRPWTSAISGKKSKAQNYMQMIQCYALDFFFVKRTRSRSRVLDLFPGFTDKGLVKSTKHLILLKNFRQKIGWTVKLELTCWLIWYVAYQWYHWYAKNAKNY